MAEPLVPLGEVVATHGLDGWLRLNPLNPNSETLSPGRQVWLELRGSSTGYEIVSSQRHKQQFLLKLRGLDHIDQALRWIGATLMVEDSALAALKDGEYYQYQVIGFQVVSVDGKAIGTLVSTLSTAAGPLYVVQGPTKEHLIPAVKEIVEKVDFNEKKIVINPPEGLLDL
jgi:16S rRNA processing protein RimM